MAASRLKLLNSNVLLGFNKFKPNCRISNSFYCTQTTNNEDVTKQTTPIGIDKKIDNEGKPLPEEPKAFATLLRYSKFIDLGNPKDKVVEGTIYHVVGNDLYIDFGWKFPTVCLRPPKYGEKYLIGTKVRLLIKDLELATKFIGSTTDVTLCEADCVLLGLSRNES